MWFASCVTAQKMLIFNCDGDNQQNTVHISVGFMLVIKLEAECPVNVE
jgi:hypothetical protein